MIPFTRDDCRRAVAEHEPCSVTDVARAVGGATWSHRTTVRNYLYELVDAGELIVDLDRRPMLFAVNHLRDQPAAPAFEPGAAVRFVVGPLATVSSADPETSRITPHDVHAGEFGWYSHPVVLDGFTWHAIDVRVAEEDLVVIAGEGHFELVDGSEEVAG